MTNDTLTILGANTLYTIILMIYINLKIKSISEIKKIE